MNNYKVEIDVPVKIWQRWTYHIEAKSEQEAKQMAEQLNNDLENADQHPFVEFFACKSLYETELPDYFGSKLESIDEV